MVQAAGDGREVLETDCDVARAILENCSPLVLGQVPPLLGLADRNECRPCRRGPAERWLSNPTKEPVGRRGRPRKTASRSTAGRPSPRMVPSASTRHGPVGPAANATDSGRAMRGSYSVTCVRSARRTHETNRRRQRASGRDQGSRRRGVGGTVAQYPAPEGRSLSGHLPAGGEFPPWVTWRCWADRARCLDGPLPPTALLGCPLASRRSPAPTFSRQSCHRSVAVGRRLDPARGSGDARDQGNRSP